MNNKVVKMVVHSRAGVRRRRKFGEKIQVNDETLPYVIDDLASDITRAVIANKGHAISIDEKLIRSFGMITLKLRNK